MEFKTWLNENSRGSKIGLYPPIADQLGQYPPLYMTPASADFIYYFGVEYPKGIKQWKPGIIDPADMR